MPPKPRSQQVAIIMAEKMKGGKMPSKGMPMKPKKSSLQDFAQANVVPKKGRMK